jgi:hypothetical protein
MFLTTAFRGQVAPPVRAYRISPHAWLIVALTGIALMAGLTVFETPPPMMAPDSPTYLSWSALRTPGYPLFLSVLKVFDPDLGVLPYVQMALLITSCAFLAQAAARLGGPCWIWLLMGASTLGNPFIWRYTWQVLTESLFISFVMVFLGCIAAAILRRPMGLSWLFAASVAIGAAILVRPVGYALLGVAPLVGLVWYSRRWVAVGVAVLPAIAMLLMVSTWNLNTNGYFGTQIFAGYNIGKFDHTPQTTTAQSGDFLNPSSVAVAKKNNAYSWSIAMTTIRDHPVDYVHRVLTNFAGLWTLPDVSSEEVARIKISRYAVVLKDVLFFGLMALSFLLITAVAMFQTASPLLVFAAVAALCVNANHLLVSLLEAALPRYAMGMWPALLAMIAGFAAWLSVLKDGSRISFNHEISKSG